MAEVIRIDEGRGRRGSEAGFGRCRATTASGRPCRNRAVNESGYCHVHSPASGEQPAGRPGSTRPVSIVDSVRSAAADVLTGLGDFLRRRASGEYDVDDFGYDRELSRDVLLPLGRPLYEGYFRTRTYGVERIPARGPALLVANHSGTVALDALMMSYAIATRHPQERAVRNVGADLVFRLPFVGPLARKVGTVLGCEEDAMELLRRGELVGVFPEGYKGVGKGWRERYRLQRFGRGGFIELALRAQAPIVPVAIVGAEEAYPMIANARLLARAGGFPYFPITPTFPVLGPFGVIPLPSKWIIEFGEPITFDDYPENAAEDPMTVFHLTDEIRDSIQQMIYTNLKRRGHPFF